VSGNDVLEEARIAMSERLQAGKNAAIVLLKYNPSPLSEREEVLPDLGHPVISALGSSAARCLDLSHDRVGLVALLRPSDSTLENADFNCPADNPPLWVRMVTQALAEIAC
jgi:hypothetical protein